MSKSSQNGNDTTRGIRIDVYNNDVSRALRKLKKKLAEDGIFQDLKNREYFESKGTKRRKAKEAAIRRHKKQMRDARDN
jgi:ribosomal protein S21